MLAIIVAYNNNSRGSKALKHKGLMCWSLSARKREAGQTPPQSLAGLGNGNSSSF